jgi:hypothetical protein
MASILIMLVYIGCFFVNLFGMVYYSWQATHAPSNRLLYLGLAIWSTGLCYYMSSVLHGTWIAVKKIMDEQPKQ